MLKTFSALVVSVMLLGTGVAFAGGGCGSDKNCDTASVCTTEDKESCSGPKTNFTPGNKKH